MFHSELTQVGFYRHGWPCV